ncbi:hypothetical protein L1887_60837 [Cichorium endivia]|nr:hypothetical protein L1887_60837 [Cichorium endivia]
MQSSRNRLKGPNDAGSKKPSVRSMAGRQSHIEVNVSETVLCDQAGVEARRFKARAVCDDRYTADQDADPVVMMLVHALIRSDLCLREGQKKTKKQRADRANRWRWGRADAE